MKKYERLSEVGKAAIRTYLTTNTLTHKEIAANFNCKASLVGDIFRQMTGNHIAILRKVQKLLQRLETLRICKNAPITERLAAVLRDEIETYLSFKDKKGGN